MELPLDPKEILESSAHVPIETLSIVINESKNFFIVVCYLLLLVSNLRKVVSYIYLNRCRAPKNGGKYRTNI